MFNFYRFILAGLLKDKPSKDIPGMRKRHKFMHYNALIKKLLNNALINILKNQLKLFKNKTRCNSIFSYGFLLIQKIYFKFFINRVITRFNTISKKIHLNVFKRVSVSF